jgi:AraC family transcriptional regulator
MPQTALSVPITFGRRLSRIEVAGVVVTETEHGPHTSLGFHDHEAPNLNFVLGGSHAEKFRSKEVECLCGSIVVKPGGAVHANQYGGAGSRAVVFEFPAKPESPWGLSALFREIRWVEGGVPSVYAWQAFQEARMQTSGWRLRTEELLLLLCTAISDRELPRNIRLNPRLNKVRDYLECSYAEELTVTAIAAMFDLHPVYLTRAFQQRFGCTVAQFIRRKRLDRAVREIASTSKRTAEIAAECGFYDQSHLTNSLRTLTGLNPKTLRSLAR